MVKLPPAPDGPLHRPYWCRVGQGYARHWADHIWHGHVLTACNYHAGPPMTDWEIAHVAICYWCSRKPPLRQLVLPGMSRYEP